MESLKRQPAREHPALYVYASILGLAAALGAWNLDTMQKKPTLDEIHRAIQAPKIAAVEASPPNPEQAQLIPVVPTPTPISEDDLACDEIKKGEGVLDVVERLPASADGIIYVHRTRTDGRWLVFGDRGRLVYANPVLQLHEKVCDKPVSKTTQQTNK